MRPRSSRTVPWCCAAFASGVLAMPVASPAQSMPGMDMAPQPDAVAKPSVPAATKSAVQRPEPIDPSASPVPAHPRTDPPGIDHDGASMPDTPMDPGKRAMPGMGRDAMPDMDRDAMPMAPASPKMEMPVTKPDRSDVIPMPAMGAMQGGAAPSDARDPDAYADGLENGRMPGMDMADDARHLYVLIDRLEVTKTHAEHGQALDAQAWYGGDLDKIWLKVDGERDNGRLGATRTEALWDHAIATYWSLQTGVRQDFGDGPGRTWAAFGVQGLSPYWFDVEATVYVGEGGRTALRLETEYDLLLTQRLILQPDVKIDVFGRDDARRGIGAGLAEVEAGLRLRYGITRKVAPYAGVVWKRNFGNTARLAREADGPRQRVEAVAGVRFWF